MAYFDQPSGEGQASNGIAGPAAMGGAGGLMSLFGGGGGMLGQSLSLSLSLSFSLVADYLDEFDTC